MKRGSQRSESGETDSQKTGGEDAESGKTIREDAPGDQTGIDALQALQIIGGGIAILAFVWLILRNVLHII